MGSLFFTAKIVLQGVSLLRQCGAAEEVRSVLHSYVTKFTYCWVLCDASFVQVVMQAVVSSVETELRCFHPLSPACIGAFLHFLPPWPLFDLGVSWRSPKNVLIFFFIQDLAE